MATLWSLGVTPIVVHVEILPARAALNKELRPFAVGIASHENAMPSLSFILPSE
jgi:hypothetical protein